MNNKQMLTVLKEFDTTTGIYKVNFLDDIVTLSDTAFRELRNKLDFKDIKITLEKDTKHITLYKHKATYKGLTIIAQELG